MKSAIVIQHVDFEDLGSLGPVLEAQGYRITTYRPPGDEVWTIDIAHADLVVILGGPMSANDGNRLEFMADELRLARSALDQSVHLLGICLGAQVIALAAGGSIAPMDQLEVGMAQVELTDAGRHSPLRHLPPQQPVLHWHGEAITLPKSALCLAKTDQCPVQAFSMGPRVLGLQFHLESDLWRIGEWTRGHSMDVHAAGKNAEDLEAELETQ